MEKSLKSQSDPKTPEIFNRCFAVVKREGLYGQCLHRRMNSNDKSSDSFCKRHQKGQTYGKIFVCYKDEDYLVKWQCELVAMEYKMNKFDGVKQIRHMEERMENYLIRTYESWSNSKTLRFIMRYNYGTIIPSIIYGVKTEESILGRRYDSDDSLSSASTVIVNGDEEGGMHIVNKDYFSMDKLTRQNCPICFRNRYKYLRMPCCNKENEENGNLMCYLCWDPVRKMHRCRCPFCRQPELPSLIDMLKKNNPRV